MILPNKTRMNPQNQTTNRTQSTRSVTNQPGTLDVFQPNAGRSKRPAAWLLLLALCFGFAPALPAALRTWNGGGADINWGTAGNWGGSAVAAGDDLLFTGATKLFNSNNIVSLRINSLSYSSSGFLNVPLTNGPGYTLMITNGIVDTAGNNTNNIPLILGGSQSFSNQVANSLHVLGSTINMSNYSLTFGGAGTNFFNGIISGNGAVGANSISVNDGGIRLAAANTFNGDLNINSGTVQLGNAAAIPSGNSRGNVKMGAAAALDLGNVSPAVNGLNGVAGSLIDEITTNAGTYTFQLGTANSNGIFAGTIANSHGIINVVKAGTGAQTLSGNNTYSGFLRVDGGTLTNSGANSYFGSTIINAGSLVLAAGGSMASTNINVAPGAVFNYGGAGTLNLNGNLVAGRATGFAPDLIGDLALSGGNLTMIPGAAGTLTLNGNLTLTGGNLNFDLNNTATIGSGVNDLIVLNGGSLDISGGTTTVKIKPIAGALAGGTYTIISNSTANIVGGPANLLLAAPRGISATFDTTTQPKNLLVTASGAANPASIVWAGNGAGGNWDVVQSQNWLSNGVPDLFYDLDTVTFNDAAGSANSLVGLPNAVSPTATVVSNSTAVTYTLGTLNLDSGLISGTGGLTKNGSGTAILNAANNYTGDTTVNLGTLILGSYVTGTFVNNVPVYNGIPAANLVLGAGGVYSAGQANTFNSATFGSVTVKPGGSSISMRNRQSNNTTYFYQFNGITRQVGGTVDFNNLQTRSGSHVGMYFTNTTVSPVNGILGGYATVGLNNWIVPTNGATLGSGPLGDVAFWGATSPFNYQVNNATPSAWGSVSNVQVTATPGASLTTQTINSLKLTNSTAITVTIGAAQTLTLASGGLLNPANGGAAHSITGGNLQGAASADLIVHQNNIANALTIGSVITDNTSATALTKAGAGTLILTGNSTYSGVTYINGATINGGANATPGAAIAAGTLQIGSGATSGGISNSPSIANEGTLTFSRSDAVGYAGTISGNGGVKQSGTGTTTLTGNNTYAGATTITAGILQIGNGGASGSFSNSASVSDSTSLVINRTGTLGYAGVIAGGGSLTVQGGVNVILGGVNTHSGNTTVSAGRLTLGAAGSISNSPLISVAAGALLDASATGLALNGSGGGQTVSGSGSVSGNVSVGTSTSLAPAGAGVIGTMTLSNALAMVGGTIGIDLSAGATRDLVDVKGNLTLTSGSIALNNLGGAIPNGSYTIITYAGSLSGAVANLTVSGFSQVGQVASLSSATAGQIKLVVASGAGANLTWIGDGGNNFWDVNTSATWNNGGGASIFNNGDNVVMNDVGNANPLVNLNASLAPATVYVSATTDYTLTSIGKITGGTGLTKSNSAVLNVLTTNDNSGTTVIGGGGIVSATAPLPVRSVPAM